MYTQQIKIKILISFALVIFLGGMVHTTMLAQDKTMMFMDIHSQKNQLNPAFQQEYTHLSLNIASGFYLNNSSLTFNDMLTRRTANGISDTYWDFETIDKKLRDKNFLNLGINTTPIFLGLRLNEQWYVNFSASLKNSTHIKFPRSISQIRLGNADLENNKPRTIDLNHYGFDALTYAEYSFGASKKLNSGFTFGAHVKALMGLSAVKTNRFMASIQTADDFSSSELKTDIAMDVSGTWFEVDKLSRVFNTKRSVGDMISGKEDISLRNMGIALDIGFTYTLPNKKWDIYASLVDLGFIRWAHKPQSMISKDRFVFDGAQFSPYIINDDDFDFTDYLKQYADTLGSTIVPVAQRKAFKTALFPKTYVGATYRYSDQLYFNGLFNAILYKDNFLAQATIGTTWLAFKNFGFTGTLSYSNYSLYNLGLGFVFNTDRVQFYMVTDNINSFDIRNSRGVNVAFGVGFYVWKQAAKNKSYPSRTR